MKVPVRLTRFAFIVLIAVLAMPFSSQSQSLARQVIGAAGGTETSQGIQMSWTLGQSAVSHRYAANGKTSMTEGFQQPWLPASREGLDELAVQIAPNPVQSILTIMIPGNAAGEWTANLTDVRGKTMLQRTGLRAGSLQLDLNAYPAGVYFLSLRKTEEEGDVQTFKVVKL